MGPSEPTVTPELVRLTEGDSEAASRLIPVVYEELRKMAGRLLDREPAGQTLQATALVHEAFLRLVDADRVGDRGRTHFLGLAAGTLRRVLIDRARARQAEKRGGAWQRITIHNELVGVDQEGLDLLDLDAALDALARVSPRPARVAELRFLAGLTVEEVAALLEVTPKTVKQDWRFARAWLLRRLGSAAD